MCKFIKILIEKTMEFLKNHFISTIAASSLIPFLIMAMVYRTHFPGEILSEHNAFGLFGDYMGGVLGSTFAFLSFMALLYTIHLQRKALSDAREDATNNLDKAKEQIAVANKQMEQQRDLADKQIRVLQIQQFETTFFNMLNQINNISESFQANIAGEDKFNSLIRAAVALLKLENRSIQDVTPEDIDSCLKKGNLIIKYGNLIYHILNIVQFLSTIESLNDYPSNNFYLKILAGYLSFYQKLFLQFCYFSNNYFLKPKEKELLSIILNEIGVSTKDK